MDISSLLSGALGSLIVFVLGVFCDYIKWGKNRKIDSRSYISIDNLEHVKIEFNDIGKSLEKYSTESKFRIINTQNYLDLKLQLTEANFIVIKNIGNNIILDCNIRIKVYTELEKERILKTRVPLVLVNEEIYIMTSFYKDYINNYCTNITVEIICKTLSNEKMKFTFEKEGTVNVKSNIFIKRLCSFKSIAKSGDYKDSWSYHKSNK